MADRAGDLVFDLLVRPVNERDILTTSHLGLRPSSAEIALSRLGGSTQRRCSGRAFARR